MKHGRGRLYALRGFGQEERSAIAKVAAEARWGAANADVPKATHEAPLEINAITIPAAVLEDGTRVLSRIGVLRAIGRKGKAKGGRKYDLESQLPVFLTADNLKPFISNELRENSKPMRSSCRECRLKSAT